MRKRIGYLSDTFGLYDDLKVWEYLDYYSGAYNMVSSFDKIDSVLDLVTMDRDQVELRSMDIDSLIGEDHAARARCRSTPVHSTLHFGGRSQSVMLGPFLWGERAVVAPAGEFYSCMWASGERHDLRSLGAIAYECLTGTVAFTGDTMAILFKVCNAAPVSMRMLAPDLPATETD